MSNQSMYYEKVGDSLKGLDATKAYRAAQNHLAPNDEGYLDNLKRLQDKIINSLDEKADSHSYSIWQIKNIETKYKFMPLEFARAKGFNPKDYEKVYEGAYKAENKCEKAILEELYRIFNVEHPIDYKSHSLSVSDVVVLDDKAYYCDSFSWELIDDFNVKEI